MIKEYKSGNINIAEVETQEEFMLDQIKLSTKDIIVVNTWQEGLIKYPKQISWHLEVPHDFTTFLNSFPSDQRSSIKKRYLNVQNKYNYKIINTLNDNDFNEWNKGYRNFLSSIDYGDYRIADDWYEKNKDNRKALLIYNDNGVMQGGAIINSTLENKLSMGFAWYSNELKKDGGSTFVICELVKLAMNESKKYFSFGRDSNLYGGKLSLGLLQFKKSWNSFPTLTANTEIKGLIINQNYNNTPITFYSINESNNLVENIIK
jgi:hypothetical protein